MAVLKRKSKQTYQALKKLAQKIPLVGSILSDREQLLRDCGFVPPGHFYSPIPSLAEIKQDEAKIFAAPSREILGIDLREQQQLELLQAFLPYYTELPFPAQPNSSTRYHFENESYSYADGILLYCMLRHLQPNRLIEVGSGFSSCVTLDTNELFLDQSVELTFIEPYPELLLSLMRESDQKKSRILPHRLQDVDVELFDSLECNDILFIDSTHVAKIHSDVNIVFFEILPRLKPGVYVHFHDIFFPFEYPKAWVYEGRAWNELYLLRAFLQYNSEFEIVLMNTFMEHFHTSFFAQHMPLCLKNRGGSIWIRRVMRDSV
ncbi:class I SAM-dependent methyltransferase [Synechococcales cyanobacterium C]|uniref:Class I SAM-dependent methyltransferase n=1 Tax=Petrachloros mirabilis ULC683 TaxID=2781853 RepID=A0A8K1ZVW4_9CYAN|nr:class I SAM-dependent methyltransferase [Petrachloros mirabilis ULC683]